jgi:predicted Zn-dependent protease
MSLYGESAFMKNRWKNEMSLMVVFVMVLCLAGCAVDPVTGRTGLMLLSEEQEVQLGIKTDREIVKEYGIYGDMKLGQYVTEIGRKLGSLSHRPHLAYEFKIMDTSTVNAFAVPGGFVYMTRGILAYINSEAELAAVLGHEIGHITARHSAEQYSRAQLAQIGLTAGMIISPTFARFGDLAGLGVQMLFLRFSRDNEREADDLGVEYAMRAGYEGEAMAHFFEVLERLNPASERGGLPEWFSTHPNPEDRIGAVRSKAAEWKETLGVTRYELGRERYLEKIDGLIYGDDPREGYTEAGFFHHPALRFTLPVPKGWSVLNRPSSVTIRSPEKSAAVILTLSSSKSPDQASSAFVRSSGARIHSSEAITINGLPARLMTCSVRTDRGLLALRAGFVEKGGSVFQIIGVSSPEGYKAKARDLEYCIRGFRELSDPSRLEAAPERIRIVRASSSGPLRAILAAQGVPASRVSEMALINGKGPDDAVEAGFKLKIIRR